MTHSTLLEALCNVVGPDGVITDDVSLAPKLTDWRKMFEGKASCAVRPRTTDEVASVVNVCRQYRAALTVQGGNTGLAGGSIPDSSGTQVIMSLDRMNAIREVDPMGLTMVVEAGCVLQVAQERAAQEALMLPVSFAAEGSATIGGAISTNAGGVNVLRYGMMRNLVLGLEVVLPNGEVADGLKRLRKNNAGYDWKQLFIGSEGTLGIVTAAALRLVWEPAEVSTSLLAVKDASSAIKLLALAQRSLGDQISAFEIISPASVELLIHDGIAVPLTEGWLVLMEAASSIAGIAEATEAVLATALEGGLAHDGIVAGSKAQARAIWAIREQITEVEAKHGRSIKHDVSIPIAAIPAFLEAADNALAGLSPPARANAFGHAGDGNLHYNVLADPAHDVKLVNRLIHDIVAGMEGSISAEHGIGQYRVDELERYASSPEMNLMKTLKEAIDPELTLNPGKVLATTHMVQHHAG